MVPQLFPRKELVSYGTLKKNRKIDLESSLEEIPVWVELVTLFENAIEAPCLRGELDEKLPGGSSEPGTKDECGTRRYPIRSTG